MRFSLLCCFILLLSACRTQQGQYVCKPCDLPCDSLLFEEAGTCPHCGMALRHQEEIAPRESLIPDQVNLRTGVGAFVMSGGKGRPEKLIEVFYYKPSTYRSDSPVLMVIPGAGRNGDSYRDAWIETSEQFGVLILSPRYPDDTYGFEAYHLCGLVRDMNLGERATYVPNTNIARLDEANLRFTVNPDPTEWLFEDFDRIFEATMKALGGSQRHYDLFGHSAGGQILHRMAVLDSASHADRIIAANSGFFTLPDPEAPLPFGLKDTGVPEARLRAALKKNLILLLGEIDNADETGGTLLRSPSADRQGLHRLARGQYFYRYGDSLAKQWQVPFNWEAQVVPGVGHDFRKMSAAAANRLYGGAQPDQK